MDKVFYIIGFLCCSNALNPMKCQEKPKEKHCLIEWMARDRWPHTVRYVYDWATRSCFQIRWSKHCADPPAPAIANNFPDEKECVHECSGWN
nr:uncharacterized protein LOC128675994 [Plodia interpunctella]